MTEDQREIQEFLRRYLDPAAKPASKAAEILWSGVSSNLGPKLDLSRPGRKRWVTRVNGKADPKRFTIQYPVL